MKKLKGRTCPRLDQDSSCAWRKGEESKREREAWGSWEQRSPGLIYSATRELDDHRGTPQELPEPKKTVSICATEMVFQTACWVARSSQEGAGRLELVYRMQPAGVVVGLSSSAGRAS